jgi:hypothetical protein
MVLPFPLNTLKEDLQFTYGEVGWIMVALVWVHAWVLARWKLSAKWFHKIMVFSLFVVNFFVLVIH